MDFLSEPEKYEIAAPTPRSGQSVLIFIDPQVEDPEILLVGVREGVEAILLDADRPGLVQIDEVLRQRSGVSEIHILSHGEPGEFQLGSDWVNAKALERYRPMLARWGEFLTSDAEILVYGCQVVAIAAGKALLHQLHNLTGASVAGSATLTGHVARGGNWCLEYAIGSVKSERAVSLGAQQYWRGVLAASNLGEF